MSFQKKLIAYSEGSSFKSLSGESGYFIEADIVDKNPSAVVVGNADVDDTADTFTEAAHGYETGLVGQFTTSGGLPTGLSLTTDYYIIKVDKDTFMVASSLVNAQAGTQIDISSAGTGDHTFTPTAISGSIKLQSTSKKDPVEADWKDVADSSVVISGDLEQAWNVSGAHYDKVRYYLTLASGQVEIDAIMTSKRS